MTKKKTIWTRICRRCNKAYKTYFRAGKVCPSCYVPKATGGYRTASRVEVEKNIFGRVVKYKNLEVPKHEKRIRETFFSKYYELG